MQNPNNTGGLIHHNLNILEGNKTQANVKRIQAVMNQGPSMDGQCYTPKLHILYMYFFNAIM